MRLPAVTDFLKSLPYANESSDRSQIVVRCPFCGDSTKSRSSTHFSIKTEVEEKEPLIYQCFQPGFKCGAKGILTSDILQRLGCTNMSALLEISKHNSGINKKIDKYSGKNKKDMVIFNLNTERNRKKLAYINQRMGLSLEVGDLKRLKIQLSLYDYLSINSVRKLAFKKPYCDRIDESTISFVSMYDDYLICRDISKDNSLGKRYVNYRIRGEVDPNDTKIYTIPTDIDIISPEPTVINVAEGAFSILGVYFWTDIDRGAYRNEIFCANCGTGYFNTISHLSKQYGLTDVVINIFSDSEVKMRDYYKLYTRLKSEIRIREFKVIYNTLKEDFGHKGENISPSISTLTN